MTIALCFSCGETKFGALCPCSECSAEPSGDVSLDILFSDHNYSVKTLTEFGHVIKAISAVSDNDEVNLLTFLLYISNNHSDLLQVKYEEEQEQLCMSLLEKAAVPKVTVEESPQAKMEKEYDTTPATDEEMESIKSMLSELKENQKPNKSWWKFWK